MALSPKARKILMQTCVTLSKYVEENPNDHGGGRVLADGFTYVPSHDADSHERELAFWEARLQHYHDQPIIKNKEDRK